MRECLLDCAGLPQNTVVSASRLRLFYEIGSYTTYTVRNNHNRDNYHNNNDNDDHNNNHHNNITMDNIALVTTIIKIRRPRYLPFPFSSHSSSYSSTLNFPSPPHTCHFLFISFQCIRNHPSSVVENTSVAPVFPC